MKLTWHTVGKDARRLWVPVALWALLLTAKHGVDWRLLHVVTEDAAWVERMRFFAILLSVIAMLVSYVLAAAVVMEDPLTGTTAFWMTRPASGARLLGAKALACVVLFLALPVLLALPWWLARGWGAQEIWSAACELLRWQAWVVAPAVVVAAFTGSFGRFLAWTLALPAAAALLMVLARSDGERLVRAVLTENGAAPGHLALAKLVALLGLAAALFVQFETRRMRVAFAILGACAAGALMIVLHALW